MKLPSFISRISKKFSKNEFKPNMVYNSIETLPIWNWYQIPKNNGDLRFLYKSCKGVVGDKMVQLWYDLQDEYIERFGLDADFEKELALKKQIIQLNCDYVLTQNKFNNTLINIAKADLKALGDKKGTDFYIIKDSLEKHKGFKIDPKTTSVVEWFSTIKNLSNGKSN